MVRKTTILIAVGTAVASVSATPDAQAQGGLYQPIEPRRGETVLERPRPQYDPQGQRIDSFLLYPSLDLGMTYRDNIFFTPNNKTDDLIGTISPAVQVQSDWNNHQLVLFGNANIGRYVENPAENFIDWQAGARGRVDIRRDSQLFPSFQFANRHEERGSPDDVNGIHPIFYDVYTPGLAYLQRFNRVSVLIDGDATFFDFNDVPSSTGLIFNQDDRDRVEYRGGARVSYEIVPEYEAFIAGNYNVIKYDMTPDDNGFIRDSNGYNLVGGTEIDFGGKVFGNVFAGVRQNFYDDSRFSSTFGPSFGADVTWNATGLTTVNVGIVRSLEESTITGASGFWLTRGGVSVDHELLRNLILSANSSYQINDYRGITRQEDVFRAGGQARWLINRYLNVTFAYDFQRRDANVGVAEDYTVNSFLLSLVGQF